jgi:hypothetical protein
MLTQNLISSGRWMLTPGNLHGVDLNIYMRFVITSMKLTPKRWEKFCLPEGTK